MKHKILFSILSILGIASILGLSFLPKEEVAPLPITHTQVLTANQSETTKLDINSLSEVRTKADLETGIQIGGLTYQLEAKENPALTISSVSNASEVETLILFYRLFDEDGNYYIVNRSSLPTLEAYTNLKNVIAIQNNCNFTSLLTTIPNSFSYYCFGKESLYYNKNSNIDKYYICSPYETIYTNPHTSDMLGKYAESSISQIYFMDYTLAWTQTYLEDTTPIPNKTGTTIELKTQSTKDSIFPEAYIKNLCAGVPKLTTTDFKATPYYSESNSFDKTKLKYKITNINPKLRSFNMKENYILGEETPELKDLIWRGEISNNELKLIHAENLIYTLNGSTADFILWSNFKTTRFYPIDGIKSFSSLRTGNSLNDLEFMVYEPTPLKDEFSRIRSDSSLSSHIGTYDMDTYQLKIKQFESINGNIYYTNDETLSIDTLESYISQMTEGDFTFTTAEALDTQYQAYLESKPEEDLVDDSEFIKGYQALGSIYYTSSKSLEDILKIASNYILQKDGVRCDEEKEVSFFVDGNTLNIIIKVNGKIVASVSSHLHKLDSKDYGEFIYLQNVGAFYGVLLFDTTSTTTKTPQEIYSYLLHQVTYAEEIPTPDFKDFSLTSPSSVDINSSLTHTNGNQYTVQMECLSFDLAQAKDLSTPEITIKQAASEDTPTTPGDKDKEDTPNNPSNKDKEEKPNGSDKKEDDIKDIFNDFKDNFENNKTFKTMSIVLGTILGLALIYVIYLIIHKLHKWLKK